MYYLFLKKESDLNNYKKELERVRNAMNEGKTPVYSEMRNAKTCLYESLPYNTLQGIFVIISTLLIAKIQINDILKVAIVLIINNIMGVIANYIFTIGKHYLRIRLCNRLGIAADENTIASMESLEYQSV